MERFVFFRRTPRTSLSSRPQYRGTRLGVVEKTRDRITADKMPVYKTKQSLVITHVQRNDNAQGVSGRFDRGNSFRGVIRVKTHAATTHDTVEDFDRSYRSKRRPDISVLKQIGV